MIVCVFDPLAIAMVLAVNKFFGRKEEEVIVKKESPIIEEVLSKDDIDSVEEMIKKNEEILATKTVKLKRPEKIYNEFSKPYQDGDNINIIDSENESDDVKTY
tara:strand:- start:1078 stop:1386 length:309 start_codon:yes stop_codon:yes gene_type:complete